MTKRPDEPLLRSSTLGVGLVCPEARLVWVSGEWWLPTQDCVPMWCAQVGTLGVCVFVLLVLLPGVFDPQIHPAVPTWKPVGHWTLWLVALALVTEALLPTVRLPLLQVRSRAKLLASKVRDRVAEKKRAEEAMVNVPRKGPAVRAPKVVQVCALDCCCMGPVIRMF